MPERSDISPTTIAVVVDDGTELVVGRVDARRPDLALVDALMRLQLLARRQGWRVVLREPTDELCGLLALVGLDGVVGLAGAGPAPCAGIAPCAGLAPSPGDTAASGGQPGRQAELREQLGEEEVVQPGDPFA